MSRLAVFDTSIYVASESRGLIVAADWFPVVSFATVAELQLGVALAANDAHSVRLKRQETLDRARRAQLVGVTTGEDDLVTIAWADLRSKTGRAIKTNDSWIAATALAFGLPLLTQDDDYDAVAHLIEIVKL